MSDAQDVKDLEATMQWEEDGGWGFTWHAQPGRGRWVQSLGALQCVLLTLTMTCSEFQCARQAYHDTVHGVKLHANIALQPVRVAGLLSLWRENPFTHLCRSFLTSMPWNVCIQQTRPSSLLPSLTHSLAHSLTHSLTHSLAH